MPPDFEEKTFEAAANGELRLSSPQLYAPGQVAEGILGFDVATFQPANAPIWNYLQVAGVAGLRLLPNLWQGGNQAPLDVRLPSFVVSLIVQYKRAEYMFGGRSGQYAHWHSAYYRFKLDGPQQQTLARFEAAVGGHAVVRYGSPAFYQFNVLEQHTLNSRVLANTNFVPPRQLAGHEVWTYISPGGQGFANPRPEKIGAESWPRLQEVLLGARRATTVLKHLRFLAAGAVSVGLVGQVAVPPELNVRVERLDAEFRQGLADLLTIGRVVGRLGGDWWLRVEPVPAK